MSLDRKGSLFRAVSTRLTGAVTVGTVTLVVAVAEEAAVDAEEDADSTDPTTTRATMNTR